MRIFSGVRAGEISEILSCSRTTRKLFAVASTRTTRAAMPVGPMRFSSIGASTAAVRHWAAAKPAQIRTSEIIGIVMRCGARYRTAIANTALPTTTSSEPIHSPGSLASEKYPAIPVPKPTGSQSAQRSCSACKSAVIDAFTRRIPRTSRHIALFGDTIRLAARITKMELQLLPRAQLRSTRDHIVFSICSLDECSAF